MVEAGIFIIALIVMVVALLVWFGIPRYKYRFGKKSLSLTTNKIINVNTAKKWRRDMIDKIVDRKGEKELFVKTGEFGAGMIETVKYALERGFKVTAVSGNKTFCESKDKIIKLLEKFPEEFKYYVLGYRPEDHFAIIGKNNLFIEIPHEWDGKINDSLGIEDAYDDILNRFKIKYENTIKTEIKKIDPKIVDDINFVKSMECYDEGIACTVT